MAALLTGQLAHVFLVAILDAALISWIALRWYRRSVRRLMRQSGTPAASGAVQTPTPRYNPVFGGESTRIRARLPESRIGPALPNVS